MDLGGRWLAAPADDELRRHLPDPEFDDGAWEPVQVPGQWRSQPGFAGEDGPLFYRRRFDRTPVGPGQRAWLTFEGLFYQSDVWLDGSYLGDTEGYFAPQTFEVTQHLRARQAHLLAVELSCARPTDLRHKHNVTGVFQHWDAIDPAYNPGGIWAPVAVTSTGPVRLAALRVLCREATAERATLDIQAVLDADEARVVRVTTSIGRHGGATTPDIRSVEDHNLAAGANRVRWRLMVERPALWWPHALGDQPLHELTVDVGVGGRPSDRRTVTTGLRQVRVRGFVARVNGERLFLKGANVGPTRRALGEVSHSDVQRDVALAAGAGLDLLRVHAHIAHPELYAEADRTGMLLWQDLPLEWRYGQIRRQAARQARQAVDLLGHHPAIIMWCGHDEPSRPGPGALESGSGPRRVRDALAQSLPSWNRTGLDRSVKRALERADGSRPVIAHAGVAPHPAGGTDTHLSLGWEHGDERDLPRTFARWPILARFVGSFGPPAVPATAAFMEPGHWPDLDWDHLRRAHGLDTATFARRVPPRGYRSFDAWRAATQRYQAGVIRHHVETIRRLKYRPTGGFCCALLADAQPGVSRSLLDHERVPKLGYAALAAACAPVIVVADRLDAEYRPGAKVRLDVHAVSDLRHPLTGIDATAVLSWAGGSRRWQWSGDVPADACVRVGRLATTLPDDVPAGPLRLDLVLRWDTGGGPGTPSSVDNHYNSRVAGGPRGRPAPAAEGRT